MISPQTPYNGDWDISCNFLDKTDMIIWRNNYRPIDQLYPDNNDILDVVSQLRSIPETYDPTLNYHTSYFIHPSRRPERRFVEFYSKILDEVITDVGLKHRAEMDYEMWMQVYTRDSKTFNKHDHFSGNEFLSWVHFVKPESKPCFHFLDSKGNKIYPEQKEGDFIVFPSWILHEVDPPKDHGDRIVISGNIMPVTLLIDNPDDQVKKLTFRRFDERFSLRELSENRYPKADFEGYE